MAWPWSQRRLYPAGVLLLEPPLRGDGESMNGVSGVDGVYEGLNWKLDTLDDDKSG